MNAILEGHDTLALLPTGGGKSVCFQVPAMMLDGICIVVTPLIALMKDQVEHLKRRGIDAAAIHSGMSRHEIDICLDNCIHGRVKFLYIAPERIQTEMFQVRVAQMKVALLAVDEAHCISQWGYDFRPSYLKIALIRELKPQVPVVALTATATRAVSEDIIAKLLFRDSYKVFSKTFARDNLSFVVRPTENKEKKLFEILQKIKGSAIIYVRSRKATQEMARRLEQRGIKASYYHAGLDHESRAKRQEEWIKNKTRVMVSTNAFGMGIDKPDVRVVIHTDLPENIESYYQEAGRAGRDGQRSYAVVLYHEADIITLKTKIAQTHPSIDFLKKLYQALANYYQLAVGSGYGESYDFDLHIFAERFGLQAADVYNALKRLEEEGVIQFNESFYSPSHLHFLVDAIKLYEFQIAHAPFDALIKMLLRLYGGELYAGFVRISEAYLARALQVSPEEVQKSLTHLHALNIMLYQPVKDKPQITFLTPRQDADHLVLDANRLEERKQLSISRMEAMINFVSTSHRCRMQMIQEYFDEDPERECGICDVCIGKRKNANSNVLKSIQEEVLTILSGKVLSIEEVEQILNPRNHELFVDAVREMVEEGVLVYDHTWRLKRT